MSNLAGERLEVGDDEVGLVFVDEVVKEGEAFGGFRDGDYRFLAIVRL